MPGQGRVEPATLFLPTEEEVELDVNGAALENADVFDLSGSQDFSAFSGEAPTLVYSVVPSWGAGNAVVTIDDHAGFGAGSDIFQPPVVGGGDP